MASYCVPMGYVQHTAPHRQPQERANTEQSPMPRLVLGVCVAGVRVGWRLPSPLSSKILKSTAGSPSSEKPWFGWEEERQIQSEVRQGGAHRT